MDLIDQIITASNLSQLDRYKSRYEELVNLSQSERDSVESSVKKDIEKIKQIVFTEDIKNSVKDCLRWKFVTGYFIYKQIDQIERYLPRNKDDLDKFIRETKDIFEHCPLVWEFNDKYKFPDKSDLIRFENPLKRDDFDKSLENIKSFVNIVFSYIYSGKKNVYLDLDYLIGNFSRNPLENVLSRKSFLIDCLEKEKVKIWFKSNVKISEYESQIQNYIELENMVINFKEKNSESIDVSFTRLTKYGHDRKKVWYLEEVLEVLQALRENTKLKHFLLEKGFDLGLLR